MIKLNQVVIETTKEQIKAVDIVEEMVSDLSNELDALNSETDLSELVLNDNDNTLLNSLENIRDCIDNILETFQY